MKKIILVLLSGVLLLSCNTFEDKRDGKVYKTVKIGNQVWMAENLAYLPKASSRISSNQEHFYVYNYIGTDVSAAKSRDNFKIYGVLYNWRAALTACPEGWHLPSREEWYQLSNELGGWDVAGLKMKEKGFAHWKEQGYYDRKVLPSTNESGFNALPGGALLGDSFGYLEEIARFWSSTEGTEYERAYYSELEYDNNILDISDGSGFYNFGAKIKDGYSVRCVKDN